MFAQKSSNYLLIVVVCTKLLNIFKAILFLMFQSNYDHKDI